MSKMAKNKYNLPEEGLTRIRKRDKRCVYCRKRMIYPWNAKNRSNSATIEHLNHLPPWNNIETVAYCCGSCNSSRGKKTLNDWFKSNYCIAKGINEDTVAEPVKEYMRKLKF